MEGLANISEISDGVTGPHCRLEKWYLEVVLELVEAVVRDRERRFVCELI